MSGPFFALGMGKGKGKGKENSSGGGDGGRAGAPPRPSSLSMAGLGSPRSPEPLRATNVAPPAEFWVPRRVLQFEEGGGAGVAKEKAEVRGGVVEEEIRGGGGVAGKGEEVGDDGPVAEADDHRVDGKQTKETEEVDVASSSSAAGPPPVPAAEATVVKASGTSDPPPSRGEAGLGRDGC